MTGIAWLGGGVRRVALGMIIAASLGVAVGMLVGGPAFAAGETGGSPTEPTGTSNCPSSNPPNQMTLVAGTPQTAILQSAFATGLQVALSNSDGCPVTSAAAGVPVTFSAPVSGASGVFSTSNSNTTTVGADSSGAIMAPTFTANGIAGSYTVAASSQYGSVSFALTNTAAGTPARLVAVSPVKQTATVAGRYRQAPAVKVLDGDGSPVAGVSVTFTLTASTSSSACGTSSSAGSAADASFAGGAAQASATSNASGIATSPALTANGEAGTFTASAALGSSGGSEPHGGTSTSSIAPALFTLTNLAGKPAKLTPGVGSTQSTAAGSAFSIRLAVIVTDAQKNPVPGALITFSAPTHGASGRFAVHARGSRHDRGRVSHPYTVRVKTSACGIAVAPAFTANVTPGGYIVKASAKPARPAAFALVNVAPGQSE